MSALRDLIVGEAELDDEDGEESFDEETGEVRRTKKGTNGVNGTNGHFDDSSEEEEDDNDEEAARQVNFQAAVVDSGTWPLTFALLVCR